MKNISVLVFEMNIRCLAGLLSAYTFTEDAFLIRKAVELADRLFPAFETPSGIPRTSVNLKTCSALQIRSYNADKLRGDAHSPQWTQRNSVLADVGSLQLEFTYLTMLTNHSKYQDTVQLP